MILNKSMLQTLINYFHCSSYDETRTYLNGVAIRKRDGKLELAASDGFVAIRSLHEIVEDSDTLQDSQIIVPNSSKKLLEAILKNMTGDTLKLVLSINKQEVKFINLETLNNTNIRLIFRDFPSLDRIWPVKEPPKKVNSAFSFDPDKLYQLRKAIYGTRKVSKPISFDFLFYSTTKPMSCKHEVTKWDAIDKKDVPAQAHEMLLMPIYK